MKIAVIFTGGTIGSTLKGNWVGIDDGAKYTLLQHFEYYADEISFIPSSPYTVLSENLSANELNLLQKEIAEKLDGSFDGIIVTHGTDTLQYSATAIELAFYGCNTPIVFVSANFPLSDSRSNGFANFEAAIEFLKTKPKGVFVSYKNDNENVTSIHVASHTLTHRECDANVYSIDGTPYAVYDKKIIQAEKVLCEKSVPYGITEFCKDSGILVIDSFPGNSFCYNTDGVYAIILRPYHSATLCTSSEYLASFCKQAKASGIPVFVANVKEGVAYESAKAFADLGITPLPYSTFISSYLKLWIANSKRLCARDFVREQIANEISFE